MTDLAQEYFLFKFSNMQDHEHVLYDGAWIIFDHYLVVRKWRPNFDPETDVINRAIVWVQIPNLPIEYYSTIFFTAASQKNWYPRP